MENKHLEEDQFEDLSKHLRIVRFDIDHPVIIGELDYRKYFAKIKADVIAGNSAVHYDETIDFRFDLEWEVDVDVCSEFKYKGIDIYCGDYPEKIDEIRKHIKMRFDL